jgi:hypothetical protein
VIVDISTRNLKNRLYSIGKIFVIILIGLRPKIKSPKGVKLMVHQSDAKQIDECYRRGMLEGYLQLKLWHAAIQAI